MSATVAAFLLFSSYSVAGQQQPSLRTAPRTVNSRGSDERIDKLPPELREAGRALLDERDADKRGDLADELAKEPAKTMGFLLAVLDPDSSAATAQ